MADLGEGPKGPGPPPLYFGGEKRRNAYKKAGRGRKKELTPHEHSWFDFLFYYFLKRKLGGGSPE